LWNIAKAAPWPSGWIVGKPEAIQEWASRKRRLGTANLVPVIINDNHARTLRDLQYPIMGISRAEPQTSVARS